MSTDALTGLLPGIISAILGGGLITAYVAFRKQKKSEPIEAETASVLNAKTAGELALAVAKSQESTIKTLTEAQAVMRTELDQAKNELAVVRSAFSAVSAWIRDLFVNWEMHRQSEEPPGGLPPGII